MVHGHLEKDYLTSVSNSRHQLDSDLTKELGGSDKAMNPHELLEAALVACTLQTIHMYAKRKGWNVGTTKVGVKFLSEGKEVVIGRTLAFDPHLNGEQRDKLTEIANKCPIHKVLHAPITIQTQVVR
jgi:putative redox protein